MKTLYKVTWTKVNPFCSDLTKGGKKIPKNYLLDSCDR
jgi:hypothetical protein